MTRLAAAVVSGFAASRSISRSSGLVLAVVVSLALLPSTATAHPLGNRSVNHLTYVKVFPTRVSLLYVLDQAELPTTADLRRMTPRELFLAKLEHARRSVVVTVDGRRRQLVPAGEPTMHFRTGVGNLPTVRISVPLIAPVKRAHRVEVRDDTFPGRLGVVLVVPMAAPGTAVRRLDGPVDDPSQGLRLLPPGGAFEDRRATLAVTPGAGTVAGGGERRGAGDERFRPQEKDDPFARLFERAVAGEGVFLLLLAAAFAWGAFHALSPGHGKGMVAAYLLGTSGRPRHAIALGAIVTVTHTAGVFALGLVTLALTQFVLPEQVYPWLNLAAGLLIVAVGLGVLRSRIRWGRRHRGLHPDAHAHDHDHATDHHHDVDISRRGVLAMGVSAGLIPCPSALVVLLAALTQNQVVLGLILIGAFSLGLAATLTALGLAVVYGKRRAGRLPAARRLASTRLGAALPAVSTLLILGLGVLLTVRALPGVV